MTYRIGEFTLDIDRQEVRRGSDPVPVQKKVFELLLFLIEHRHRVLDKDEIQEAVWPDTIVSETALTRAILKARRALDDDAQQQSVIKTVHGTGYRFVAEVEDTAADAASMDETADQRRAGGSVAGGRRFEDRRADLLRVATAYGAIAWLTNQIAAMVFEAFELEKLGLQIILGVSVLGLPIALGLTWLFTWTEKGLKRRDEVDEVPSGRSNTRYFASAIILMVAIGVTMAWQLRDTNEHITNESATPTQSDARVAVLPVLNQSGLADDNWTRLGIMSLLAEELRQARVGVLSSSVVVRMVGEDVSGLIVDESLMNRFATTQNISYLVVPVLNKTARGYSMSLELFDGTNTWSMEEAGDVLPTELAMDLSAQLVTHLRPERYATRFKTATSGDAFVNELFARGMHEELSGNLTEAKELFALAVKQDPEFFLARYEYAITIRYLGEFEEAEPLLKQLMIDAESLGEPHYIAVTSNALGVLYDLQGKMDEAETTYIRGIEVAKTAELSSQHATLLINYAILQRLRGELSHARQLIGQALSIYRTNQIPPNGSVYVALANISVYESNLGEAEENYHLALETYERQEQPSGAAIALSNLAWLAQEERRYDDSLVFLERSLQIRRDIDDRVGILKSLIRQSSLQFDMGLLTESQAAAEAVIADSHSEDEQDLKATAVALIGMVAAERGDTELGIGNLQTTIDIRAQRQDISGRLTAENVLAEMLIKAGSYDQAGQLLDKVIVNAVEHQQPGAEIEAHLHKAQLTRMASGVAESLPLFQATLDKVRLIANEPLEQKVAVAFADAQLDANQVEAAECLLGFVTEAPSSRELELTRAKLHEMKGEAAEAVAALQRAKVISNERWSAEDEANLNDQQNRSR